MSQADFQIRSHAHVGREPDAADGEEGALRHTGQLPRTTCFSGALIIPGFLLAPGHGQGSLPLAV